MNKESKENIQCNQKLKELEELKNNLNKESKENKQCNSELKDLKKNMNNRPKRTSSITNSRRS